MLESKLNLNRNDWVDALVQGLSDVDEETASFIVNRRVSIGFWKKGAHVGAFWLPGRRIYLNLKYFSLQTDPADPHLYSLIIHEVCHLRQGLQTALSIYGELEAWQLGFRVYQQLTGQPYHQNLIELMSLPLGTDREILRRAQVLMQVYAGKNYRADLLPLYPFGRELRYRLGL